MAKDGPEPDEPLESPPIRYLTALLKARRNQPPGSQPGGFADRRKKGNGRALTGAGAPHSPQTVKESPGRHAVMRRPTPTRA